jgi:uncharacterized membrane protein
VEGKAIGVDSNQRQARNSSWTPLLHRIFVLGVVAKGVDGALELFGGLLLLLLSPTEIRGIVLFLVQGELKEDPTDVVANLLVHNAGTVIQTRISASAFLIVHGVVKLGLIGGLATGKLWSYPVAIVVFTGFAIYQLYQLVHHNSLFLEIISVLDLIVIFLIIAEYRNVRLATAQRDS